MSLLSLLLVCGAASAAHVTLPKTVGLHPLLLGDPASMQSPLRGALEIQAATLIGLGGGIPAPAPALAYNLGLAIKTGTPVEKAAALVTARLIVDRPAAEAFFSARPELDRGDLGRLPGLDQSGGSYRGDPSVELHKIAASAAADPSVSWLFDGGKPEPELGGLARKGARVWTPEGRGPKLKGMDELTAEHPLLPGADLIGLRRPRTDQNWLALKRDRTTTLADIGAGPRWLGGAAVAERGRLDLNGTHPMGVVESVYGKTVSELADHARFGPAEYRLVEKLLEKLAKARLLVEGLGINSIKIGRTLADPEPRAFVMSPDGVRPMPPGLDDEQARRFLEEQLSFVRLEQPSDGGDAVFSWPQPIWQPLGEILRESVRQPKVPILARLRRLLGGKEPPKQLKAPDATER